MLEYLERDGIITLDYYGKTLTCLQIPLGKLLKDGFNTGHGFIRPPRRPGSATALAAIILQSNQNDMHGGQSFAFFDRDMAPYFEGYPDKECFQACEALIYNLNSMHSRAGAQVPFSSLNLGTDTTEGGRSLIKNILLAYEKGLGHGENPIFPNIIFKVKKGVNFDPGDPNYDLFQLAIRVASKRLNPTFSFLDSTFNAPFGDETSYMGCRTRTLANCNGPEVSDGRGNLSFTTINLPRIGIKAKGNLRDFYTLLKESLDLATQQLLHRYETQATLKVRDMPFLMGQHLYLDSDNLKADDEIREAIKHGTLSVGFIGLAECLAALIGKHHGESEKAQALGLSVVKFMREYMDEMTAKYDLNFTLLGTPAEGLSGRFLRIDRKEFGEIPGVTNKEYYTNSSHVPVSYKISAFEKIKIEAPYQEMENAGHISYIELTGSPQFNLPAVETLIRAMADANMGYCGINFPIDFCNDCNFFGIINDVNCECGSDDISRVRRITGYLSTTDRFNDSKRAELHDRTDHVLLRGE